jgi:hypothetical protein
VNPAGRFGGSETEQERRPALAELAPAVEERGFEPLRVSEQSHILQPPANSR